jgi:hypothetical protein
VNPPLLANMMFLPAVKEMVGAAPVLNCQPAGAFITNVLIPAVISPLAPSAMVIVPNVVNAGVVPPIARLAQIPVPPVPGVTVIAANKLWLTARHISNAKRE